MRIRLLLVIGATLAIAACGESTTAPGTMRPGARTSELLECRTGYHIATRADGTETCEPDGEENSMAAPPASPDQ